MLKDISWSVLPLVAGLFVLVEGVDQAGVLAMSQNGLRKAAALGPLAGSLSSAFGVALLSNVANNLPIGLVAGSALHRGAGGYSGRGPDRRRSGAESVSERIAGDDSLANRFAARWRRYQLLEVSALRPSGDDSGTGVGGAGGATDELKTSFGKGAGSESETIGFVS